MTRFARSKGSKSSNERIPESATPWSVMSSQIHKNKSDDLQNKAKFEAQRKANYENFLKEEAIKKSENSWCEFPNTSENTTGKKKKKEKSTNKKHANVEKLLDIDEQGNENDKKKKKNKKFKENENFSNGEDIDVDDPTLVEWCNENPDTESDLKYKEITSQLEIICKNLNEQEKKGTKKRKGENKESSSNSKKNNEEYSSVTECTEKKKKKSKSMSTDHNTQLNTQQEKKGSKKRKVENKKSPFNTKINNEEYSSVAECTEKNKSKSKKMTKVHDTSQNTENTEMCESKLRQTKKKLKNNDSKIKQTCDTDFKSCNNEKNNEKSKKRKKPLSGGTNIIVNGESVDIVIYQGFPITSKDAGRIEELRKALISKGIPRSEVERTIKLERRRAEKSLARLKKNLCFHCRKGGHILSECPDLNKDNLNQTVLVSGICFKCGSTDHTHFNCKVVRTQEYKFAQCFICKEQGHISRQCPDNPKGIYPKGGACRVCGDVTHLRKDCPKVHQNNENDAIKLDTLQSDNIEDIDVVKSTDNVKKQKIKHIRY